MFVRWLLFSTLWLFTACSQPAEEVTRHMENMVQSAEKLCPSCENFQKPNEWTDYLSKHPDICSKIGASLNQYLKAHGDELRDLLKQKGESKQATAQRIYTAAKRLDLYTESCRYDSNIQDFQKNFSTLVANSAGKM